MADNSKWVFLKAARVPSMFQREVGEFKHIQREYESSKEKFSEFLDDAAFGKQTREINKAMGQAGLDAGGVHIQFVSNKVVMNKNPLDMQPEQLAITIFNIKGDKEAVRRFGQNLFDAKPHDAGGNLQWIINI